MKWEVTGANRETGEDTSIEIEADTEESAVRRAGRRGVLASSVVMLTDGGDSIAAVDVAPPPIPALNPLQMLAAASPQAPLNYRAPLGARAARPANGLGVAGVVMGIVSMLICWIPVLGIISVPLSLIGLILAAVGILMSLSNRRTGVGFPVAGVVVCIVSIIGVIFVNALFIGGVGNAIAQANAHQQSAPSPFTAAPRPATPVLSKEDAAAVTAIIEQLQRDQVFGDLHLRGNDVSVTVGRKWLLLSYDEKMKTTGYALNWGRTTNGDASTVFFEDARTNHILATFTKMTGLEIKEDFR